MTTTVEPTRSQGPRLGVRGWLRWGWRTLTSMRTALILLLLLALASIPGSVFPQRGTDAAAVAEWINANPQVGPWLDRFGMFDVFAAPWFAAVYLLLIVSLIGCIVPRTADFLRTVRMPPPAAPSRLSRMPAYERTDADPQALDLAEEYLRAKHWRVRRETDSIAAEKGYLQEVGNLLFHLCFIFLLLAVAVGGLFGWSAKVIVVEGRGFTGSLTQFDSFRNGRFVDPDQIAPFSVVLKDFTATFQETGQQAGAPRQFDAKALVRQRPGAPEVEEEFSVNSPLVLPGVKVFLTGHGYAPEIKVTRPDGTVIFDDAVVFLPRDGNLTSSGVVKVPDVEPGFALTGLFLPTATIDPVMGPISTFPAAKDPQLFLGAFTGDVPTGGNVYKLDTSGLERIGTESLRPGQTWTLPDGTDVEFVGYRDFANLSLAHDPGRWLALVAAALVILGVSMSLLLQRRRVWIRMVPGADTVADVAGLSRSGGGRVHEDVREIVTVVHKPQTTEDETWHN
ncbi:MAG TPA: cytochrome c biogenesis protein ResB [Actinomycetota bacterium]|nr:cytochrome c biogenesis protein ResB [Actinomycetota bacterium]HNL50881.1 cytochrome c biogenesis protein ResB [Actinomycetota bacterium]HNO15550.1 cytochrome c biogenesis protein ResB [Actinomycetota bacterium]